MTLKKTLPAMTLILALIFAVSTAMAQAPADGDKAPMPSKKMGMMGGRMSPEDKAAWKELWKEHHQKIEPLRDQLWAKDMEYDFLVANPNTKLADVKAVIDEMLRLKVQLRTERGKLFEAAEAKGLDTQGFGHGFHKAWRGPEGGCGSMGDGPGFGPSHSKGPGKGPSRHHGDRGMMGDNGMND